MVLSPIAREQVAVADSVTNLTATTVKTAKSDGTMRVIYAEIDVQDADIYVTFDGSTDPSATAGEIWYQGDKKRVWGVDNLTNLKFIRVSSSAVLEVTYWGI